MAISSYKGLLVWQKSMELVTEVYRVTTTFPKNEIYGLANQIRKTAVSIPSNIAEGSKRGSKKDYRHFIFNAYGSGAELETQIEIAKRLSYISNCFILEELLDHTMRMLNKMIQSLNTTDNR